MGCASSKKVLKTKSFQNLHQSFTLVAAMPIIEDCLPAKNHEQFVAMTRKNNLTMQASAAATQETLQSFVSKDNEESEEWKVTEEDKPEIINTWELTEGLEDGETDHISEKPFDTGDQARTLRTIERLNSLELEEYDKTLARSKTYLWNRKSKMYLYYLGHMPLEIDISSQENNLVVEVNEGKIYSEEINLEKHQSTKQNSRKSNLHERVKSNNLGPISIPSTLKFSAVGSLKDWPKGGEHIYSAGVSNTRSSGSYICGDQSFIPSSAGSSRQFWIDKAEIEMHSSSAHELDKKAMIIIDSGVSSYSSVCSNSSLSANARENWENPLFDPELIASFEKELKQVSEEEKCLEGRKSSKKGKRSKWCVTRGVEKKTKKRQKILKKKELEHQTDRPPFSKVLFSFHATGQPGKEALGKDEKDLVFGILCRYIEEQMITSVWNVFRTQQGHRTLTFEIGEAVFLEKRPAITFHESE